MHDIAINEKVMKRNDALAAENRRQLRERGVYAINLISSPGSGKTAIIEKTLERLNGRTKVAVIEGDIQGDLDRQRLLKFGVPVRQINTGRSCHLDAHMVHHTLPSLLDETKLDILIIENVGNMVCPAEYDLGEKMKVAVMSVTEGDDKPLKYPSMFMSAGCLLINKTDLTHHTNFDREKAKANALSLNPGLKIIETSCISGEGIDAWVEMLTSKLKE